MRSIQLSNRGSNQNLIIYLAIILFAGIGILYGSSIQHNYSFLRVWNYQNILILLLGIPFIFLQAKAGLPDFFDQKVSNKRRFYYPIAIGAFFGILDIIVFKVILHPEPYSTLPPFLQPFPYSIFLYFSGAFEIEVFYRLIPITIILLLGNWVAKGKYYSMFCWTAMILSSLREPLEQLPDEGIAVIVYSLITGFLMNLAQAYFYVKAGFLSSLTLRLGHYLCWHILLGIFVQYFELQ